VESKAVKVVVIHDKSIEETVSLPADIQQKPIIIEANSGDKFVLAEDTTGVAPENITVKKVGDDLYVSLEGADTEHPQLIIRDYFSNGGELIGKGEDGAYYHYVTAYGLDAHLVANAEPAALALGTDSIPGFADGLVTDDDNNHLLYGLLFGLGALALGGAALAIANHNDNGGKSTNHSALVPGDGGDSDDSGGNGADVIVAPTTISSIYDDVGSITGEIKPGGVTDDSKPTLSGGGAEPGNVVVIVDGDGNAVGSSVVDENGDWSVTPENPLPEGDNSLSAVVVDPDGNQSTPSDPVVIVVDTVAPAAAENLGLVDNVEAIVGPITDGTVTNDSQPVYNGTAEPNATVTVLDNGKAIGTAHVDADGNWSFKPETPLTEGEHSLSAVVSDEAGNVGPESESITFTVDTVAPSAPDNMTISDDETGEAIIIPNGGTTDDTTPVFSGDSQTPGDVITIYDGDNVVGSATVDSEGKWAFTPETPMRGGEHDFSITATDEAGNESAHGAETTVIINSVLTTGSEDFENVEAHVFDVGESLVLDSGMTITYQKAGLPPMNNAFQEIANKGTGLFVDDHAMGMQSMTLTAQSETRFDFGSTTSVSFMISSANGAGNIVQYYDANNHLLNTQEMPLQDGNEVNTMGWVATGGDVISYVVIAIGNESYPGDSAVRVDNFVWGDDSSVIESQSSVLTSSHVDTYDLDYSLLTTTEDHTQATETHSTPPTLEQLLSQAHENLFINDNHQQVAVSEQDASQLDLSALHDASQWNATGEVTAGGVTYDVYQQVNTDLEVLVQHGQLDHHS
jgi:hypothetical protein